MQGQAIPRSWQIALVVIGMDVFIHKLAKIRHSLSSPRMDASMGEVVVYISKIRPTL